MKFGLRDLDIQSQNRDHLDMKTGVILGFALVAIVEILGLLLLALVERPSEHAALLGPHRAYLLVLAIGGIAGVVFCVLFCILQLRPMDHHDVDVDFLEQIQGEASLEEVKRRIESRISECALKNSYVVDDKSRFATAAAVSASISILLFAAGVVVILFLVLR